MTDKEASAAKKTVLKLQRAIVDGLEDVKAQDIQVFDTEHITSLFERVIVASGTSNRQTKALAASVRDAVREAGFPKPRIEGEDNGEWIIVDCGAAVAHIMQPSIRQYYHLEELWGEKPVQLKPATAPKAVKSLHAQPAPAPAPKKPAAKKAGAKAPAKKAAATDGTGKKAAAKKAPAKSAAAGKSPAPKAPARSAGAAAPAHSKKAPSASKSSLQKPPVKKATAQKAAPQVPAKAPVKTSSRTSAKTAPAKTTPAKKAPAKTRRSA